MRSEYVSSSKTDLFLFKFTFSGSNKKVKAWKSCYAWNFAYDWLLTLNWGTGILGCTTTANQMVFMMRDICCPVISSWSCIKDHQIHTLTGHVRNTQNCTPEVETDSVAWNGTVGAHFLKMSLYLDFLHPAAITVKFISYLLLEEVGECLSYYGHFWFMILNDLNFW